jgi:hypothetical protein
MFEGSKTDPRGVILRVRAMAEQLHLPDTERERERQASDTKLLL